MATLTLRPDGIGSETSITNQYPTADQHWDKVDEEVADGADTMVYTATDDYAYKRDLYALPAHTTEAGVINSVTIYFCINSTSSPYAHVYGKPSQKSGTVTDGTEVVKSGDGDFVFETRSQIYTLNPATGNAYTWEEIDALEVGVSMKVDANSHSARCTQVYIVIDYTSEPSETTVTPGTASLTTTKYAPPIGLGLIPSPKFIGLSSFAPGIGSGIAPTTAILTLTRYAPSIVTTGINLTPSRVILTLTSYAPTIKIFSVNLLSAQKTPSYSDLRKLVLTYGATTKAYLKDRIISIVHNESEDSHVSTVLLDNSDGELTDLDLKAYKGIISFGIHTGVTRSAWQTNHAYAVKDVVRPTTANGYQYICTVAGTSHATTEPTWTTLIGTTITDGGVTWTVDGYQGDEYVPRAPLYVASHQLNSLEGKLVCYLTLAGIPNLLAGDKASVAYPAEATNTDTIKTIINQVLHDLTGAGAVYDHCIAYDVDWDEEDGLVDTYYPADSFDIGKDEDRRSVVKRLLVYTKCALQFKADGHVHIVCPTTTDEIDYEYSLADTYHQFFGKAYRKRLVLPGRFEVSSRTGDDPQYSGSAEDPDITALSADEKKRLQATVHPHMFLTGDDYAGWIAEAMLLRGQRDADSGVANVPMNYGAEVWDYVKVTDTRENDYRLGHQQMLTFTAGGGKMPRLTFRFGKGTTGMAGTSIAGGVSDLTLGGILTLIEGIQQEIVVIREIIESMQHGEQQPGNVIMNSGEYTGDGSSESRVIPHYMGCKPSVIFIWSVTGTGIGWWHAIYDDLIGQIFYIYGGTSGKNAVKNPDITNFYVGRDGFQAECANYSGRAYCWVAFANA